MPVNRAWKLVTRPEGLFKPTDFAWAEEPVANTGKLIVRVSEEPSACAPG